MGGSKQEKVQQSQKKILFNFVKVCFLLLIDVFIFFLLIFGPTITLPTGKLSKYKIPKHFVFEDEFPLTANGKVSFFLFFF